MTPYPKILHFPDAVKQGIFNGPVIVQEKIDGSQLSFGVYDGVLRMRSKGREFPVEAPDDMFKLAVKQVEGIRSSLTPNWTYRGEYLNKPKHNCLQYERVPVRNIILFDVQDTNGVIVNPHFLDTAAKCIGLEVVPILTLPAMPSRDDIERLLDTESCLGGVKIEGFVVKSLAGFVSNLGGRLMGKYVSEKFKEQHSNNKHLFGRPKSTHIVDQVLDVYRTEARWQKAFQHLRDDGKLTMTPKDIGPLVQEVLRDTWEECGEAMQKMVFESFRKHISQGLIRGVPEWFKAKLLNDAFEATEKSESEDSTAV